MMLVHTVLFWLKEGLSEEKLRDFRAGLESLAPIETVRAIHVDRPLPSDRPVVDSSYSFGLTVLFDDPAGHDVYQVHPLHKAFLAKFSSCWTKVQVYDFQ